MYLKRDGNIIGFEPISSVFTSIAWARRFD